MDLGPVWANVQLVTVGRFDNRTTNTEMLVQNTIDHHLYEWWITSQGQLTGIDLGPHWINVQLIGNSHYNNNSAFNELLVRNTSDGHFYEWWIANNQLTGVDLGASPSTSATVADNSSGAVAGSSITVANSGTGAAVTASAVAEEVAAIGAGAGPSSGGKVAMAGLPAASSGIDTSLPATSTDSTSLLVQSMASFGASNAVADSTGALPATDPSQPPTLAMTIEQHPAHA